MLAKVRRVKHKLAITIQKNIERNALNGARIWAQAVVEDAVERAPIKSGLLRSDIQIVEVKHRSGLVSVAVGTSSATKDYAARQEFDTSLGFGPASQAAGAMRPWLQTAFNINRSYGKILFEMAVKRGLR